MGKRDDIYKLCGEMDLDDGFFTTPVFNEEKDDPLKRGRGSQKKTKILIMSESEHVDVTFHTTQKNYSLSFIKRTGIFPSS